MELSLGKLIDSGLPGLVFGSSIKGVKKYIPLGNRNMLELQTPLPMNQETSFDLGSITKMIATTFTLMRLVENEVVLLDDRISRYISEWKTFEKSEITIRELLLHRGGLWEWRPLYISMSKESELIAHIANIPLRYQVNHDRHYSDLGFITLGHIVTNVIGASLINSELKAIKFASPADKSNVAATSRGDHVEKEMIRTGKPYLVPEKVEDFSEWRSHILNGEINDGNAFHLMGSISGHAGLFSNAEELLSFGENFLHDSQFSVFSQPGPDADAHLGFISWEDTHGDCKERFYGHTGFPGTILAISPKHEAVTTLLTNRLHVDGVALATDFLWRPILKKFHESLHGTVE